MKITCRNLRWLVCAGALHALLGQPMPASAGPIQLVSTRNPGLPLPAGGNANSIAPIISPDANFVLFCSSANDLVPGDRQPALDVFLRNRASNTTVLVSMNTNGAPGDGDSLSAGVSTNSRYVVFQSDADDLVPGDTNGYTDIFLRDVASVTTTLVSVTTNGGFGNHAATDPVMTPDGRYVAFVSSANNLVPGIPYLTLNIYLRDMASHTTSLVSVGAMPPTSGMEKMSSPVITRDGRYVAFATPDTGLTAGVPGTSKSEVYIRDMQTATTMRASTNVPAITGGALAYRNLNTSVRPRISNDGQFVAFRVISSLSNSDSLVLLYDTIAATSTVVNMDLGVAPAKEELDVDEDLGPQMTPDGRYIAYVTKTVTNGVVTSSSVHVWDRLATNDVFATSDSSDGSFSRQPVLSPNGRFLLFLSNATNLVADVVSNGYHVYRRDLLFETTALVDADTNGWGTSDEALASFTMSSNGRWVAFSSPDGGLVPGDWNMAFDVFVRDVNAGTNELISKRDPTVIADSGDGPSSVSQVSLSADGRWLVFVSVADDLVVNDTNNEPDVFVYDLLTGAKTLASVAGDGGSALGGASGSPVLSGDGRYLAFVSASSNLVSALGATNNNVYRRDLQSGINSLVSIGVDGLTAGTGAATDGNSLDPVISRDGRYVAFWSSAWNLSPPIAGGAIYWRDMTQGTNVLLAQQSTEFAPSMSSDGRYVAYFGQRPPPAGGSSNQLFVRDMQLGIDIYTNIATGSPTTSPTVESAALSPDGRLILYRVTSGGFATYIFVDNVHTSANLFKFINSRPIQNRAEWSADSRFLAFTAASRLYLYDFRSDTLTSVNSNLDQSGSLLVFSDGPVVSGDGRFVAYRTATNSFSWVTGPPPHLYLYDRLNGSNTLVDAGQPGTGDFAWVSRPAISGSGARLAFLSVGSGLTANDLNCAPDVVATSLDIGSPLDGDGDGIPDWWTAQYFGHATGLVGDLSRAQDDADGDGLSNWQEWVAGTNPTDPSSRLLLVTPTMTPGGLNLTWQSVNGLHYYIERGDLGAASAFTAIQSNIVGQTGTTTFTDTNATGPGPFFYRVGVQ